MKCVRRNPAKYLGVFGLLALVVVYCAPPLLSAPEGTAGRYRGVLPAWSLEAPASLGGVLERISPRRLSRPFRPSRTPAPAVLQGPVGRAVQFDGLQGRVTFGPAPLLGASTFTIETWFRRDGPGSPATTGSGGVTAVPLVTKGTAETDLGDNRDINYFLGIDSKRRVLAADFEDTINGGNHPVLGATAIADGVWYHAAATYDGTTWRLYLNGSLETQLVVGNFTPCFDSIQHAALATAMNSSGSGGGAFLGALDEVRIWNVARSAVDIQSTMAEPVPTAPGLIGRWGLDEGVGLSANDSSGSGITGTLRYNAAWTTGTSFESTPPPPGAYGLRMKGTTSAADHVSFGPSPNLGAATFTVETWFRRENPGATTTTGTGGLTAVVPLVAKGRNDADGNNKDLNYLLGLSGNLLAADFEEGASGLVPGLNHPITGTTAILNNQWYHGAVTYDGVTLQLYLNGVLEAAATIGRPARADSINHAAIGTALNSTGVAAGFFAGTVDEARIWNYARTAAQIASGKNREIPTASGLLGRWGFGQCCSALDSSGQNVTGTLFGSGWTWLGVAGGPLTEAVNYAPVATVGADQSITLPATALLSGSFTDDDRSAAAVTTAWTRTSGPGTVTFGTPGLLTTTATFSAGGTYVLALAASDGELSGSDSVTVQVDGGTPNLSPVVNAGADQITTVVLGAALAGVVTDDGQPGGVPITLWSKVSGPGTVTFGQASAAVTTASFSMPGTYVLMLSANDGLLASSDSVTIQVNAVAINLAPVVNAGADRTIAVTGQASLAGTVSDDGLPGGAPTILWSKVSGPGTVAFGPATAPSTTAIFSAAGTYVLMLTANDSLLAASDTVSVTVTASILPNNAPEVPVLNSPTVGGSATSPATLNVSVSDSDGDPMTVTFYGRPKGVTAPDFTVVAIPDTQHYVDDPNRAATFTTQTNWIVGNRAPLNIVFASHLGDITEHQDQFIVEWQRADTSLSVLEANSVPYGMSPGNHDQYPSGVANFYDQFFPPSRFLGQPWYGGYLGAEEGETNRLNKDNYELFTVGGLDFLVIHIETDWPSYAVTWADKIIKRYPNRRVILSTHAFLNTSNVRPTATQFGRSDGPMSAEAVWQQLIRPNCNVFMVINGHYPGEGRRTDLNNCGQPVHQVLTDYQSRANGGDGWLRYYTFKPSENKIYAYTYSPTRGQFEADASSQFTLDYAMQGAPFTVIGTNSGVASGSNTTTPRSGLVSGTEYEWYATANDGQATTTSPTWSFRASSGGNSAPVALNNAYTVAEDGTLAAGNSVLGNDTDADGNSLTAILVQGPLHGTVALSTDGSFIYTPTANYNGPDSFSYKANDGIVDSNVATVSITVTAVNDPPAAVDDSYSVDEDTLLNVAGLGVLANDNDPDGNTLTALVVQGPAHGALLLSANGTFTYMPAGNYSGPDGFTYRARDGTVDSNVASVSITVSSGNDGPVSVDDAVTTAEDTLVTSAVLANDTDGDGDTLSVTGVTAPAHGSAVINPDRTISYTPAANYNGPDTFTYTVGDGNGGIATATVNVTVTAVNDVPVAVNDAAVTAEDTAVSITVLANDTDLDGDTLSVSAVTVPAHGTAAVNPDRSVTYTPAANYNGADSFSYTFGDSNGGTATATVNVTVTGINDGPVGVNDTATTAEDTAVSITVLANDTDLDGDTLSVSSVTVPAHGTAAVNPDRTITYTPAANYNGPDSFSYTVGDSNGGTATASVNVTVTGTNDGPVAVNDAATTAEDTAVSITVLANDTDLDGDTLTVSAVTVPTHGTAAVNPDGTIAYTPAANYNGADSFTYTANDGIGGTATATVTVTTTSANDGPVAVDDAITTPEDAAVSIAVLPNDSDLDGDTVSVTSASTPVHGTTAVNANGTITYTPAANYNGADSFSYTIGDGNGGSATATVSVTVTGINDGPVAVNDTETTAEDTAVSITVLANDTDLDDDTLSVSAVTAPAHGTATVNPDGTIAYTPAANYNGADSFTYTVGDSHGGSATATVNATVTSSNDGPVAVNDTATTAEDTAVSITVLANDTDLDDDTLSVSAVTAPAHGTAAVNPDGTIAYTPAANYHGADSFSYTIGDGNDGTTTATVTVTVTGTNDAPLAVDDTPTTEEDTPVSISVLANDSDADGDTLAVTAVSTPAHGAAVVNPDNSIGYTPAANYNGTDSFSYTIGDAEGASATARVNVTITGTNDGPVAVNDTAATAEDTGVSIPVLTNDSDLDGDALAVTAVGTPSHGAAVVNPDKTIGYTPAANYSGTDGFTYTIGDGNGGSATATVTLTVSPLHDAPEATDDRFTTPEEMVLTVAAPGILANDRAGEGEVLTATLIEGTRHGSLSFSGNGGFVYTPAANYSGADSFTYKVSDGSVESGATTVVITVTAVNDAPVAVAESFSTLENISLVVAAPGVTANDTDLDGDVLSAVLVSSPTHGTVTLAADGSFIFAPAANYSGADNFSYRVNDGTADSNAVTVAINISEAFEPPVALDDVYTVREEDSIQVAAPGVLANDRDGDGDPLTARLVSGPSHGLLVLNTNGFITYWPEPDFAGTDSFTYQAHADGDASNLATVTITVTNVNDPPWSAGETYSTDEDTVLVIPGPGVLANDIDIDSDILTASRLWGPDHGEVAVAADGGFTYIPDPNYNGLDRFFYMVRDQAGAFAVATVTLTIKAVNAAPVAINQAKTVTEDGLRTLTLTGIDGENSSLTFTIVTPPAHGVLLGTAPAVTYQPYPNYNGPDSFTFRVNDGHSDSAAATVSLTVTPVNDAPAGQTGSFTTPRNTPRSGVLTATDVEGNPLTYLISTLPTKGTVTVGAATGAFTYTPFMGRVGTDSFRFRANDGLVNSAETTIGIVIQ